MINRALKRIRTGLIIGRLLPAYVLLGLLKHLVPVKWLVRWAWCSPVGPRDRELERQLTACIIRLSQLIGRRDRDCLQRSLLLYRVLSGAGADPTLVMGFQRANDRILGHAWVVVDGQAVLEPQADLRRFSVTLQFGSQGTLLPPWPDLRAA
jgi:Transglutaminase-like superfamily